MCACLLLGADGPNSGFLDLGLRWILCWTRFLDFWIWVFSGFLFGGARPAEGAHCTKIMSLLVCTCSWCPAADVMCLCCVCSTQHAGPGWRSAAMCVFLLGLCCAWVRLFSDWRALPVVCRVGVTARHGVHLLHEWPQEASRLCLVYCAAGGGSSASRDSVDFVRVFVVRRVSVQQCLSIGCQWPAGVRGRL